MLAAFDEQAVEKDVVKAFGSGQRVRHALARILVEIQPGGAERQIEIDNGGIDLQSFGDIPGDIVRDRGGTCATARAREHHHAANRRRFGIHIEIGDRLDDMERCQRGDQIFGNATLGEFAVELHVIHAANHDHFRGLVAHIGELFELAQHRLALPARLYDEQIGSRMIPEMLYSRRDVAGLNAHMGFRKPAVGRGFLKRCDRVGKFGEGLYGNTRHRAFIRRGAEPAFGRHFSVIVRRFGHRYPLITCRRRRKRRQIAVKS